MNSRIRAYALIAIYVGASGARVAAQDPPPAPSGPAPTGEETAPAPVEEPASPDAPAPTENSPAPTVPALEDGLTKQIALAHRELSRAQKAESAAAQALVASDWSNLRSQLRLMGRSLRALQQKLNGLSSIPEDRAADVEQVADLTEKMDLLQQAAVAAMAAEEVARIKEDLAASADKVARATKQLEKLSEFEAVRESPEELKKLREDVDAERRITEEEIARVRKLAQELTSRHEALTAVLNDGSVLAQQAKKRIESDIAAALGGARSAESAAKHALEIANELTRARHRTWSQAWHAALKGRCATAVCWGGTHGHERGIEPVVDLPVGLSWGVGQGALAEFINSAEFRVEFTAGLRTWFRDDAISLLVYFAKPIFTGDERIRPLGSTISYPTSAVRRVYPSIGVGLFGDMAFFGVGLDELRNPTSDRDADPRFGPGEVVSRSLTFTLGIAPFTSIRNGIGAASEQSRTNSEND